MATDYRKPEKKALACPFCGRNPEVIHERRLDLVALRIEHFKIQCRCYNCKVKPHVSEQTLEAALENWNRREKPED